MKRSLPIFSALVLIFTTSCDTDNEQSQKYFARWKFSQVCDVDSAIWFDELVEQSASGALRGKIYLVETTSGTFIIAQADMMSCLGCSAYYCSGERLTGETHPTEMQKISISVDKWKLIFNGSAF